MTRKHVRIAIACTLLCVPAAAWAGTDFYGRHEVKEIAMNIANEQAWTHARANRTCFHGAHKYPVSEQGGVWVAKANAANHRGSCPRRLRRGARMEDWMY